MTNKTKIIFLCLLLFVSSVSFVAGYFLRTHLSSKVLGDRTRNTPTQNTAKELAYLPFTIPNLQQWQFQQSEIKVDKVIGQFPEYTSYQFSYKTRGKKMTGQMNVPKKTTTNLPVIVLLRGYVDQAKYTIGEGTRPAAAAFAKNGYITFAPDFFGFGESDPDAPGWESRFEKPINVVELIRTLRAQNQVSINKNTSITLDSRRLGIWGHSNGGQIALSTLEVMGEPIPTTLWAPVTAPFPYSILYFSDELEDEGKGVRASLAALEEEYNMLEFSLTQYLDRLQGPLQLHHGTADDAAPKLWSDEFVQKLNKENERRQTKRNEIKQREVARQLELAKQSTAAAQESTFSAAQSLPNDKTIQTLIEVDDATLQPVDLNYFVYPGADHNLRPGWDTVIERDLEFFAKNLK